MDNQGIVVRFLRGKNSVLENLQTSAGAHTRSGAHSLELKRPGRQTDNSPPPSTKVKNERLYISSLMCPQGMRKDNFVFY